MRWISFFHFLIPVVVSTWIMDLEYLNEGGFISVGVYFAVFFALWMLMAVFHRTYFFKVWYTMLLLAFFVKELILANLKIAHDVLSINTFMEPAIVALPLEVHSEVSIMLMANIISLTPGTLSLRLSDDRKTLYVHTLYLVNGSKEEFKNSLKEGFEKKILAITT
jgi:multicomponent Na+:H+ antiporter subunit E